MAHSRLLASATRRQDRGHFVGNDSAVGHFVDRAFSRWGNGDGLFTGGWGDWRRHYEIGATASDVAVIDPLVVHLDAPTIRRDGLRLVTGRFRSPLADAVPAGVGVARLWWLRPVQSEGEPVWVHMAGTGESGARRRLSLARPLAKRGVSSLVLENPFYGTRAPQGQQGNALRTVGELLLMGRCAVREARALLAWLGERGHSKRGISGYSMGGHIAALAAATFPAEIACTALATGLSAVPIFCFDALSTTIRWDVLGEGVAAPRERMAEVVGLSDLDRFGPPLAPAAAIMIGALSDGYVRRQQVQALASHWPGSELRWVSGGHVTTYLRRRAVLAALVDAMAGLSAAES